MVVYGTNFRPVASQFEVTGEKTSLSKIFDSLNGKLELECFPCWRHKPSSVCF